MSAPSPSRDPALERRLLDRLVALAGRRFAVDCHPYVEAVERRLALGAERYGDDLNDGRDLMAELLEETPDVAGYALLEVQRLAGTAPREARDDLMRAALLGAVADHYARRARRRLAEEARS